MAKTTKTQIEALKVIHLMIRIDISITVALVEAHRTESLEMGMEIIQGKARLSYQLRTS